MSFGPPHHFKVNFGDVALSTNDVAAIWWTNLYTRYYFIRFTMSVISQ